MKKTLALILALVMALSLVACGGKDEPEQPDEPTGPITITVWTCNSGDTDAWLHEAAERFTKSQDKYIVEQSYAGSYQDVLSKLSAAPDEVPDIFHADTEGAYTYYQMPDSWVPIQKYVDADKFDMSNILGNLAATYTDDKGAWRCMPLGNTAAGFFYNKEMLEASGIDPFESCNSYEAIVDVARTLKAAGVKYPVYLHTSSSFYSMPLTAEGIQYVDQNNGKDGLPTKSLINEAGACHDATVDYFNFITTMRDEELMAPYATTSSDGRDMFANGEIALFFSFISSFNSYYNAVNGAFTMGFHPCVTIHKDAKNLGMCTGGGALFLGNTGDEAKERGAWEFMKFLMADENAVGYAVASGYMPITTTAVETAEYQDFIKNKFPDVVKTIEMEKNTPASVYNAMLPAFNDFHAMCKQYAGYVYDGQMGVEDAVKAFGDAVDEAIELWNLSN